MTRRGGFLTPMVHITLCFRTRQAVKLDKNKQDYCNECIVNSKTNTNLLGLALFLLTGMGATNIASSST